MPLQAPEVMSSRKRRPNWTDQECFLLAQAVQERKSIIRGKYSTGVSIPDKRQAWEEIVHIINAAFPQAQRTVSDCNKKWENLLAKTRDEIKRQKRQPDEDPSPEQFNAVTQIVISVMNLSNTLQQNREDSSVSELMETQQKRCDEEGLTEQRLPTYPGPTFSPAEQKIDFANAAKSLTVRFSPPHAAVFSHSGEHLHTSCITTSLPSTHCTTLQERMDLEMSVLRRQEEVLKLQQEYYTLKIKLMKKQVDESLQKD